MDNILDLIDAGRREEAIQLLNQGFTVRAAGGSRSTKAALEAATRLFGGKVMDTANWMNKRSVKLGATPLELAEESEVGLQRVLHFIGQLEAGVYL